MRTLVVVFALLCLARPACADDLGRMTVACLQNYKGDTLKECKQAVVDAHTYYMMYKWYRDSVPVAVGNKVSPLVTKFHEDSYTWYHEQYQGVQKRIQEQFPKAWDAR